MNAYFTLIWHAIISLSSSPQVNYSCKIMQKMYVRYVNIILSNDAVYTGVLQTSKFKRFTRKKMAGNFDRYVERFQDLINNNIWHWRVLNRNKVRRNCFDSNLNIHEHHIWIVIRYRYISTYINMYTNIYMILVLIYKSGLAEEKNRKQISSCGYLRFRLWHGLKKWLSDRISPDSVTSRDIINGNMRKGFGSNILNSSAHV